MTASGDQPERIRKRLARVQKLVTRATAIVTVSKYTATDLARHINVESKTIHVVPNGLTPPSEITHNRPSWHQKIHLFSLLETFYSTKIFIL